MYVYSPERVLQAKLYALKLFELLSNAFGSFKESFLENISP